jgi:hypothetical protein
MTILNIGQRCKNCSSLIKYDLSKREENGKYTPLDLDHKRHFCSSVDKIVHECQVVDRLKNLIKDANSTELSSFELELSIRDRVRE